jgi:hypothetical protein
MHKQLQIIVMSRHNHYPVFFSKNIRRQMGPHYVAQRALSKPCCILSGDRRKNLHSDSTRWEILAVGSRLPGVGRRKCRAQYLLEEIGNWHKELMDQISIKTPNPKCRLYWCLLDFVHSRYCQVMLVILTPLVN